MPPRGKVIVKQQKPLPLATRPSNLNPILCPAMAAHHAARRCCHCATAESLQVMNQSDDSGRLKTCPTICPELPAATITKLSMAPWPGSMLTGAGRCTAAVRQPFRNPGGFRLIISRALCICYTEYL